MTKDDINNDAGRGLGSVALSDDRWVEVTPSQFEHETEGLQTVRQLLPDHSPYRAWSNFEFRDNHGRWHEVDLLVLGRGRLHLVELKYYAGVLRGDEHRWLRDGKRAESSPVKLARRKAQYLATRLTDELLAAARQTGERVEDTRAIVPFVQESVFLHHPRFTVDMSETAAIGLFGPDEAESTSNLPGISQRLLEPPREGRAIGTNQEQILCTLMERLGLVPRRERTAGSWIIEEALVGEGHGWQDWRAYHQVDQSQHARIRFRVPPPGASESTTRELRRLAQHEFATMRRLVHDGLLRPLDLVDSELGTGLVYPADDNLQRLDLWLAEQTQGVPLQTQLDLVRQAAEAVQYAHGNAVAHRNLSPEAVWVRSHTDGSVKVLVGDWHSAGLASPQTTLPGEGVTALHRSGSVDVVVDEEAAHAAYLAPEDTWRASANDRFRLDVFGVGALAYYVLTGQAPAPSAAALRERLLQQGGLDISPALPEASETLRGLVLAATRPSPSERIPDLATFLQRLAAAESDLQGSAEPDIDPLEARPGDLLGDGRFTLVRRLGQGSTAVGLLVDDAAAPDQPSRVLKVALDDAAASRLTAEAEVLAQLKSPRLVKLLEGPLSVGGRQALLLESAGEQTLAEAMRERTRLSLDLLLRYGSELLEALAALDRAGVDHRDIKPANLGVRTSRSGDKAKHLVLFDFSLTRAAASATDAGTPPYLDPFLAGEGRPRYDSHAERYAAAVVLFEMATGATPTYGDGTAHPASIPDKATVTHASFDPSIAKAMVAFFTTALARDVADRHHTVADMQREWEAAFAPAVTTVPDNADELADAATLDTPLTKAGLSARALSAIEPLGVETVGDLVAVDAVRLNHLSGAADVTRKEVKGRASQWRRRFADAVRGRAPATTAVSLPSPIDAADLLMVHTGKGRSAPRQALARLLLGVGTDLDAFATQAQLAAHLPTPVTPARATQLLGQLQDGWADNHRTRDLLVRLDHAVRQRLHELGGAATVDELTSTLLAAMTPRGMPYSRAERDEHRLVQGMLRAVLDRQRALVRAEAEDEAWHTRRRDGRMNLVAVEPTLLEVAETLGREADRLVATGTGELRDQVVAADVVAERLDAALGRTADLPTALQDAGRRARLAAAVSARAAASGAGELHHRDLPVGSAVAHTLGGMASTQQLSPRSVQDRVRARFPSLAPLPDRPELDAVVAASGVPFVYDPDIRAYRSITGTADTTGLDTRQPTRVVVDVAPVSAAGVIGQRLRDSRSRRSFLALGVPGHRLERAVRVLTDDYAAVEVDLTEVLLRAVRTQAEAIGMKWATVQAADAAEPGSRPALGLSALVERALPAVTETIERVMNDSSGADRPILLTEASPLARYDRLGVLTQWTDLTRPRQQAVWLVVPQLRHVHGPVLDGRPVRLNSPGQFLPLDTEWIDARDRVLATTSTTSTTDDAGARA
ncbi:BREX system serine/threonine kinase PglW [Ornithinimicrobium sp. LYQ103]|uniref:BREX system serine/threonine kinase PglW n=1 Tax=Ornithinimicrobium sp. LYQ103 TaxID=3378796 RepID=UPI003853AA77